jgi:hypothetical protein
VVGWRGTSSGKIDEEISWRNGKSLCQLNNIFESHVSLSPLHAADVIAMQSRSFSQFLLRVASLVAELP